MTLLSRPLVIIPVASRYERAWIVFYRRVESVLVLRHHPYSALLSTVYYACYQSSRGPRVAQMQ